MARRPEKTTARCSICPLSTFSSLLNRRNRMGNTALAQIDEVKGTIARMAPQFQAALPAQIPVERFVRVVQTAIATNLDLLNCERTSLYAAAMKCAQDGLLPDGR